jgi:hypothetical protein
LESFKSSTKDQKKKDKRKDRGRGSGSWKTLEALVIGGIGLNQKKKK